MTTERLDPPDPEPVIDRGRLEDEAYERHVDAELWGEVVEPLVATTRVEVPQPIKKECPWCLGGVQVIGRHQLALCAGCAGKGWIWGEPD